MAFCAAVVGWPTSAAGAPMEMFAAAAGASAAAPVALNCTLVGKLPETPACWIAALQDRATA